MKRNIRNLVVITIVIVLLSLIMAAMTLAAEAIPHGIRGQYDFTGGGTALIAFFGFETNLRAKGPAGAFIFQTFSTEGVYKFERDGTGSFEAVGHFATLPMTIPNPNPSPPTTTVPPSAGSGNTKFSFHYTVTDDRKITITADPGTYGTEWKSGPNAGNTVRFDVMVRVGFISPDGKTITLTGGAPSVMSLIPPFGNMPPTTQMVLHSSAVLFYQHD